MHVRVQNYSSINQESTNNENTNHGSVLVKALFGVLSISLTVVLVYSLWYLYRVFVIYKPYPVKEPSTTQLVLEKYYKTLIKPNNVEGAEKFAQVKWEEGTLFGTAQEPEIAGQAGFLVDIDSHKVLYEKESRGRKPIASLTKIMTALVALEHSTLDRSITVSYRAANIGENCMGISEGEIYTLEELLYGLMLNSGNDAAYAISEGVAGSTETFVAWMNIKAMELGLDDTHFSDPSGLDDLNYSTPHDLAKLTSAALNNAQFRKYVSTIEKVLPQTDTHKYIELYNQTNLLTTYPGVAGVKTGYTEAAGLCLVTYANNSGKRLVGAVLNSIDRKGDMILMLDHGFRTLGVKVEHHLLDP